MPVSDLSQLFGSYVQDVLSDDVQRVRETEPIAQLAMIMAKESIPRAFVINQQGAFLGVATQHDVVSHYLRTQERKASERDEPAVIASLLSEESRVSVAPNTLVAKAIAVMVIARIDCLPVVNDQKQLLGAISLSEVLSKITGQAARDVESCFTFYSSNSEPRGEVPAFIRRSTGDIVIPSSYLDKEGKEQKDLKGECAVLGYDQTRGRIMVKFVKEATKPANAFRIKRDSQTLVIRASDFVNRFGLLSKPSTFDIVMQRDQQYLILMPR